VYFMCILVSYVTLVLNSLSSCTYNQTSDIWSLGCILYELTTLKRAFEAPVSVSIHCHYSTACCILYTHMHLFLGLARWAGTRKVKPIWILLMEEIVSGSGISWAICKSAPRSRQITMSAPHHSVFTGWMPFLPPNQQHQSTEGNYII